MYRISDFSKITSLTVKTLRYYDEEGILSPSYRDGANGYRYYNEKDFTRAGLVTFLRSLDFSISEMKEVLADCETDEDLSYFLREKKKQVMGNIAREQMIIDKIEQFARPAAPVTGLTEYTVELGTADPVLVASVRYTGAYANTGDYFSILYKAVKGNGAGVPFNLHYNDEYAEEAEIEVCLPIRRHIRGDGIQVRTLPAVRKVIRTVHRGPYSTINLAYKALLDYAGEHSLTCAVPSREYYLKGPGMLFRGNENKYVTEILIPVESGPDSGKGENHGGQ
ncbi:MerR family transcriptional regulator [Breznakiella homolactica]|uniref:MerR family transcriptional regulator n=1 Tax=Breznakiella homolactica TaxID=2798577 RepID=A0A7T7XNI9_9SPIR|nr:MerR family transcriptional regulator [Breznakiella homolactica]QQO09596.1 MerR family transcriptional regulator [Breznakiella homolactica]